MRRQGNAQSGEEVRHDDALRRLARVEGQVRGIRRMIEAGESCVDIIAQLQAAEAALRAVGRRVLKRHLERCVREALQGSSVDEAQTKIDELMAVLKQR